MLEPGGAAAFTVWDVPSRGRWLGVLVDAIEDVGVSAPADVPAGPPFFRFADENELTDAHHRRGLGRRRRWTRSSFRCTSASADELWDGLIEGAVRMRASCSVRATTCSVRSEPGSTSCSTTTPPATASRCRSRSSSARGGSRDRPRAPRRRRAGGRLDPELHRLRGGDGGVVRRPVRGARARRAVAAGRGGARERARDARRHGRRADADVQRPHGHVVLRPRALAGRDPRLPAGGVRARGADLRARDLEHEGRARRLPRGGAGARRRRR